METTEVKAKRMEWAAFSYTYCETQVNTPDELASTLRSQIQRMKPDGFMLLRCEMMDSSFIGQHTILAYGPNNTYKFIPAHPISPRGLASDMSVMVGFIRAEDVPQK